MRYASKNGHRSEQRKRNMAVPRDSFSSSSSESSLSAAELTKTLPWSSLAMIPCAIIAITVSGNASVCGRYTNSIRSICERKCVSRASSAISMCAGNTLTRRSMAYIAHAMSASRTKTWMSWLR
eukprot:Amastigsp_a847118_19.p3 type:complete len:124 gc:universal Amastigsp_a847118_19:706-335(-)